MKKAYIALAVLFVSALAFSACTSGRPETFAEGDIIGVADGLSISLDGQKIDGSRLVVEFTLDNSHGEKDFVINSADNFLAENSSGKRLEHSDCDRSPIDGTIAAGAVQQGMVCWKDAQEGDEITISFVSPWSESEPVIWKVGK